MSISMKTGSLYALPVKFLVFLVALLLAVPFAQAGDLGIDLKKLPKLKSNTLLPQKEFEAQTKKVIETDPFGEPKISYEIRLPKDWTDNVQNPPVVTPGQSLLNDRVLGIVGRYIGKPKNLLRSYITAEAQKISYEISAESWFVNFILSNGFSLSSMTVKDFRNIEAMYVQVEGDQTFVVRTLLTINGPNLLMVRYYLPQENFQEDRAFQEQVMKSFKLTKPSDERIEKQAQYEFLDQSYFNYPESWMLKEKSILSVERMSALLYQARVEGKGKKKRYILEGHIRVNVISKLLKTTLPEEIKNFRANLNIPNYTTGDLIENVKYDYDTSIKSASTQIYQLVPTDSTRMQNYEFLVTVMEGEDYYYIISMITPSREEDFYLWAQNMEAAKIIIESMRRNNINAEYNANDPYYDYLKEAQ